MTFHITLEICAELSAQTAVEQGGQVERGRVDGGGKEHRNALTPLLHLKHWGLLP